MKLHGKLCRIPRIHGVSSAFIIFLAQVFVATAHASQPWDWGNPTFKDERQTILDLWSRTPWADERSQCGGGSTRDWAHEIGNTPFPEPWPPTEETAMVYYLHAVLVCSFQLHSVRQAEPWAKIKRKRDGTKLVEPLAVEFQELGTQGFRTLRDEDLEAYKMRRPAIEYLSNLRLLDDGNAPQLTMVKEYYCAFLKRNGALGRKYTQYHRSFVEWLSCPGAEWLFQQVQQPK